MALIINNEKSYQSKESPDLSKPPEKMKAASDPKTPQVSVIIPVYNHEQYLKETVYSVLEQTTTNFEIIIINDGSADNSEDVIRRIKDKRIQYFYQENQGAHNALNRGIRLAKGKYVSILNSDDVYHENRFEEFLKILEADDAVNAVFSYIEFIDDQGNFIEYKKGAEDNWTNDDPETSFKGEENIFLNLLAGNFLVSTSNLFCRRSIFDRIGFFSDLRYAHDYDFFLRLCYHFNVRIVNKPLLKYRIHSANTIKENEAETDFEMGIILSDLLLNCDLDKFFPNHDIYSVMVKFFNSIRMYHSERMIVTLLFFGRNRNIHDAFFKIMMENPENPFRKNCIDHFQNHLDEWRESQNAWRKWTDTNERLIETDKKLAGTADEAKKWWLNSEEAWKKSEEAWKKVEDIEKRLAETQKKLSETKEESTKWWLNSQETWKKVREKEEILTETVNKLSDTEEKATKWWLDSQEAWRKWRETNERLAEHIEKFSEAEAEAAKWWSNAQEAWHQCHETNGQLTETEKRLSEMKEAAVKWHLNSQKSRDKWAEINEKLIETEQKLSEANQELNEKTKQSDMLLNSRTYRLGSALIWPVKKIRALLF
ncbi:MAG: hypothetical protein DRI57_07020 [Deltaproteobacteria bacterium]|nr:MAG: hypothetical protein DRI57_07020 [Deltaproteobacteria bacterium]